MNPVSAMPNPVTDPALAASAGPADAGSDAAGGFADALHRASNGQSAEPSRPESGPRGSSRNGRGVDREARGSAPLDDTRAPATDDGDDSLRDPGTADGPGDREAVGRKRSASDEGHDDGAAMATPMTTMPVADARAGAKPTARSGVAPMAGTDARIADTAGAPATRAKPAATAAGSTGAQGGDAADPTLAQVDGELASTSPAGMPVTRNQATAAGSAAQAAALPAGAMNVEGAKPAGPALRRSTGVTPAADRAGHGSAAAIDGAATRALATNTRTIGTGRATPGIATTSDPAPVLARTDGGPGQGFEDALLASLAPGTDSGAAVTTASTPAGTAGGIRPIALPIAAPVHSPAFPQALGQQLAMALRMDLGQAELILSPAELGPVRVELSLDGDSASVHFAAINPETRQALEQSLPDLRALFAEQGLSLADTHVGSGFHRETDARPADAPQRWPTDRRSDGAIDGEVRPMNVRIRPDALVDLFA